MTVSLLRKRLMAQNLEERDCRPASDTKQYWGVMTFYERFEHLVALVLSTVISVIILIALWRLVSARYSPYWCLGPSIRSTTRFSRAFSG